MNRFPVIGVFVLVLAVAGVVGVAGYAAGSHWHDDERVVQIVGSTSQTPDGSAPVVRVIEPERWHGHGFFPFGLFFFPLVFFGLIWLFAGGFGRRHWYGRPWYDGRGSFEEWHQHQHATDPQPPAEPSTKS